MFASVKRTSLVRQKRNLRHIQLIANDCLKSCLIFNFFQSLLSGRTHAPSSQDQGFESSPCHWHRKGENVKKNFNKNIHRLNNGTVHIRHQCWKTTLLSCLICLMNTGVEKMNNRLT
jgi:hypothetical protein